MAFTTQIFLFAFFPICIILFYITELMQNKGKLSRFLTKIRAKDLILIGFGCVFYAWACFSDIFRFLIYIAVVYIFGRIIQRKHDAGFGITLVHKDDPENKRTVSTALFVTLAAVILAVFTLIHFKYTSTLASAWNYLFKDTFKAKSITAPLGISFITFAAVSYLADIYFKKAKAGSIIDCALYLTFFPKVISGPIVLWRDFESQIKGRKVGLTLTSEGVSRIMIGFAKKLILADTFGACIAKASGRIDVPTAWLVALLYMLQIYYDFSGYSDIAIGLSGMFGFSFKENFNFPYISCSITEFWRRWHISLGAWFKEYVYIPLGGNRISKGRTIINIGVVFLLTGIWHGAGWTYMLWGILNGVCNIIEKLLADNKLYSHTPKIIKWFFTMTVTFFAWELFRFTDISDCIDWLKIMFGRTGFDNIPYTWVYYFDAQLITLVIMGVLGSTLFGLPKIQSAAKRITCTKAGYISKQIIYTALFILAVLFMINSKYSPFIYFQY